MNPPTTVSIARMTREELFANLADLHEQEGIQLRLNPDAATNPFLVAVRQKITATAEELVKTAGSGL